MIRLQANNYIAQECVSDHGKDLCAKLDGECITEQDGYYYVSFICLILGVVSVVFYIIPTARRLEGGPKFHFARCHHPH